MNARKTKACSTAPCTHKTLMKGKCDRRKRKKHNKRIDFREKSRVCGSFRLLYLLLTHSRLFGYSADAGKWGSLDALAVLQQVASPRADPLQLQSHRNRSRQVMQVLQPQSLRRRLVLPRNTKRKPRRTISSCLVPTATKATTTPRSIGTRIPGRTMGPSMNTMRWTQKARKCPRYSPRYVHSLAWEAVLRRCESKCGD